jgi:hypothetical protein
LKNLSSPILNENTLTAVRCFSKIKRKKRES